jgi:hypothetical protein
MFRVTVVILVSASKRFKNPVVGHFESPGPIGNVCSEIFGCWTNPRRDYFRTYISDWTAESNGPLTKNPCFVALHCFRFQSILQRRRGDQ